MQTDEQAENIENMEQEQIEQDTPPTEQPSPDDANGAVDSAELDVDSLKAELEKARQEAQANLDGWQRSRAEFANYKRRTGQEMAESRERGALDALVKVLPILDDFDRALNTVPDDWQDHPWINGTALILKNLQKVVDEYNISIINPVGEEFDPNFHEAVGTDDSSDYKTGIVTVTLQKGYRSGERVLRPALVRVAS